MFDLSSIFSFIGRYSDTIGNIGQAVTAVQGFMEQREAEKQTKRGNAAMMKAAEQEAALTRADAAQKAIALRRSAQRVRAEQITAFLKSGVTLDGSPMLVMDETTQRGDEDAANTITNADYSARALKLRAEGNKQQVKKADFWGTGFDVLGSLGKAHTAWGKARNGG